MLKSSHNPANYRSATKFKIDKHLKDINDTISEEDIIEISTTPPPQENHISINKGIIEIRYRELKASAGSESSEAEANVSNEWNIIS